MKCPYQTTIVTTMVNGCITSNTQFQECLYKQCPAYYEVLVDDEYGFSKEAVCRCKRVNQEQGKKK